MTEQYVFIGLDLSVSNTGIYIIDPDPKESGGINLSTDFRDFRMLRYYKNEIKKVISNCIIEGFTPIIAIEDYGFFRSKKALACIEVHGVVKELLKDFKVILVAPTTLKKYALGNGRGDKSLIVKEILRKWKVNLNSNNVADAFILAQIAKAYWLAKNNQPEKLPKYQQEVIDFLIKRDNAKISKN